MKTAYQTVHNKMMLSVKGRAPKGILAAVVKLVQVSGNEFNAALEDRRVVVALEYQHSYGFVQVAKDIVAEISAEQKAMAPEGYAKIDLLLSGLDNTWVDLTGNTLEATEPSFIAGTAARIEITALAVK